jgi:hypothetical protein
MKLTPILDSTKQFIKNNPVEIFIAGVTIAYYVGKSRGSLDVEVHFHPKGELPKTIAKAHVK